MFGKNKKSLILEKENIVKAMTNIEFFPTLPAVLEKTDLDKYKKLPLSELSSFGVAFEPLTQAVQTIINRGKAKSGLYYVTVPNGGSLAKFKYENSYLGAVLNKDGMVGGGQARLNPLACDPTMLFMAVALMNVNQKLDSIREAQKEILEFLEEKERANLKANLSLLSDILNNYKYNWSNKQYKDSNYIKILDIMQESEASILFYQERINKKLVKQSLIHIDKDLKNKMQEISSLLKEYQLASYIYAFSAYLGVMLLENFDEGYLTQISRKIENFELTYSELYKKCYNQIETYSKSSIQSHFIGGVAKVSKSAGNIVAKIPYVNKSQIDENLIEQGNKLTDLGEKRTERTMEYISVFENSSAEPFIDNINMVNRLYNQPLDLLVDKENIYFGVNS
ncbi:MAG: hypothetical protein IJX55_07480 [Clostridia bacterium]|nr:hypothetical protein [Clostridia bacterium]